MTYIDAHCHLADPRFDLSRKELVERARQKGITAFIQGGVDPQDWERQLSLQQEFQESFLPVFGLHPWWVTTNTEAECRKALRRLPDYLEKAVALGELGLDFLKRFPKTSHPLQETVFRAQLDLALVTKKPLVLHIVRAHSAALNILTEKARHWTGIVHSFSGTAENAAAYLDLGLSLSFGGPLTRKNDAKRFGKLSEVVLKTPLNRIVLESDSPDQPSALFTGQLNEPVSLWEVAEAVCQLKGGTADDVMKRSRDNLISIFNLRVVYERLQPTLFRLHD